MINKPTPSNDHIRLDLLIDFSNKILNQEATSKVKAHLDKCEECSEVIADIQYFKENFGADQPDLKKYLLDQEEQLLLTIDHPVIVKSDANWSIKILKIAATLLLLLVPIATFIYLKQKRSVDVLVSNHLAERYNPPVATRGGGDPSTTYWQTVASAYRNKDYAQANTILQKILDRDNSPMAHFYTGLCYLYLEKPQPDKAIPHLQKVIANQNPYHQQGLWYLSLAYFQADRKELCKETLLKITSYKQEEAKALLGKI